MKKIYTLILLITAASAISAALSAQPGKIPIVFYNVENVFDTLKSPGVLDEEFTPAGPYAWNSQKYNKKMVNLEEVFYKIAATAQAFPAIIGVSEIENRNVLEDIVALPKLAKASYQIVHYDSPDARGIDVALFYRPDVFKYEGSTPIRVKVEGKPDFKTRDILMTWGTIEGEKFYFFVCHWPSRRGGSESEFSRVSAAITSRRAIDSVLAVNPDAKIVLMGDLNDDPVDKSIFETLDARGSIKDLDKPSDLFNPFYEMFKKGYGTLGYQDSWNIFDNMIVNQNLVNPKAGKVHLYKPDYNKFWGNIFNKPFLLNPSGQFKNYPYRTYVGTNFQGGYSDHLPVYIYLVKSE